MFPKAVDHLQLSNLAFVLSSLSHSESFGSIWLKTLSHRFGVTRFEANRCGARLVFGSLQTVPKKSSSPRGESLKDLPQVLGQRLRVPDDGEDVGGDNLQHCKSFSFPCEKSGSVFCNNLQTSLIIGIIYEISFTGSILRQRVLSLEGITTSTLQQIQPLAFSIFSLLDPFGEFQLF